MRLKAVALVGKKITKASGPRISIVDDEDVYFTPVMLQVAAAAGYTRIERHYRVTPQLLQDWIDDPPDIVILDIKGVADPAVAKDGTGIAARLQKETSAYVAVTSAHQFHLKNVYRNFDFVIEERLLTAVDFLDVLDQIAADYYGRHAKVLKRFAFRLGRALMGGSALPS